MVEEVGFHDLDEIADRLTPLWQAEIAGRRFRVTARRRGQHDFTSADMERHLGARLLAAAPGASVDLRHPEVDVPVQVVDDRLRLIRRRWPGLGSSNEGRAPTQNSPYLESA